MAWQILVGVLVALLAIWVVLIVFLAVAKPKGSTLNDALRILPDTVRLVRRLAVDDSLPRGIRVRLWLLLAYLALPIDLIPDFLPVIGYADDVIITLAVLRSVVRRAGPDTVRRHWPGSEAGLAVLSSLAHRQDTGPSNPT